MNTPQQVPWYGTAENWSTILSGAGQGANSLLQATSASANSKKEAKEAKRRTLANLLNQALKRDQALFRTGQEYGNEMNDYQTQALQNMARGFVESLQGATNRG